MAVKAYHHGDLRRALVDTGVELLKRGGPAGLTAREAARELGVSVTALYRHFESVEQWRADVSLTAREALAARMLAELERIKPSRVARLTAIRRFRATGLGYVGFAIDEPLLFAGAFMSCDAYPTRAENPSAQELLESVLDELVASSAMPARLRPDATITAWVAVHGLAALIGQRAVDIKSVEDERVGAVLDAVARALELQGFERA